MARAIFRPTPKVISAGNVHDVRSIAIPIQHSGAPSKKARMGQDVVLEHDCLIELAERPIKTRRKSGVTAHIRFREVAQYTAGPVEPFD